VRTDLGLGADRAGYFRDDQCVRAVSELVILAEALQAGTVQVCRKVLEMSFTFFSPKPASGLLEPVYATMLTGGFSWNLENKITMYVQPDLNKHDCSGRSPRYSRQTTTPMHESTGQGASPTSNTVA
jgi:hypothetical protein